MINALNPGPERTRAVGYLDDDEDAGGHSLSDTVAAARNRVAALDGTLHHHDAVKGRDYALQPGAIPFFVHRERGWHLDEPDVQVDGRPVSATLLGLAATLFHAGRGHAEHGRGLWCYVPKCETPGEVELYRDVFDAGRELIPHLSAVNIRGIVLIESLPAVFAMEQMLAALGPYAAGLNAARWDLKASILEYVITDPNAVWPDRFDVDIKTTAFLTDIFRHLVAICARRGAVAIGGMATALPHKDPEVNQAAAAAIAADKRWEAEQGFLRAWVAHIFHMDVASKPFLEAWRGGWDAAREVPAPGGPVRIETPAGVITREGTRRNVRTLIEYLDGWLGGRGARGIDTLAGRPGIHPALMEDLATARISVAQTAQRIRHGAVCSDTDDRHDETLVSAIVDAELAELLDDASDPQAREQLERAAVLTRHWVADYLELDFRGLGSRTREELLARSELAPAV